MKDERISSRLTEKLNTSSNDNLSAVLKRDMDMKG